jgi:hypothetical protein
MKNGQERSKSGRKSEDKKVVFVLVQARADGGLD